MRRSITVFPKLTDKEVSTIVETRRQYAKAFNMSAECLINNSSTSKRFLHKVQYERIKEECPTLPTGLIQCARDVAVEAVKNWNVKRTKLKKAERMKRPSMKDKSRCSVQPSRSDEDEAFRNRRWVYPVPIESDLHGILDIAEVEIIHNLSRA